MICYSGQVLGVLTAGRQWGGFLKYSEQETRPWTTFSGPSEGGRSIHFVLFLVVYMCSSSILSAPEHRNRGSSLGEGYASQKLQLLLVVNPLWHVAPSVQLSPFSILAGKGSNHHAHWSQPEVQQTNASTIYTLIRKFPPLWLKSPLQVSILPFILSFILFLFCRIAYAQ